MMTMIKYELKKIFQSKLFIVVFAISIVAMIISTVVTIKQYNDGRRGFYTLSDMQGTKTPEVFVSGKNIDSLRQKLSEFEANDEIYEPIDPQKGGNVYMGKYDAHMSSLFTKVECGEMTEDELNRIAQAATDANMQIKKEYLPEYFKLYQPVHEYDNLLDSIKWERLKIKNAETEYDKAYYTLWLNKFERQAKAGFTVGYDYGWDNLLSGMADFGGLSLIVLMILGLCNLFSCEYAGNTDALLFSSKYGRGKNATAKLLASIIFVIICISVYLLSSMAISFSFLGVEGANVGRPPHIEKFLSVVPCIILGCVLLMLMTLAVSSLTHKLITSVFVSLFLGLLPFGLNMILPSEQLSRFSEMLPASMVYGSYIITDRYAYIFGEVVDIKLTFIPVAIIIILICLPIIYVGYCKRQVKN